ncbi:MAG: AI-2E family transporter [Chthoniobacteraceae bacterium]
MKAPSSRTTSADAIVGLWTIALASFVMALLYFAQDLLIPLALAALLTFLLAPLVSRLERWLGRVLAVLVVVVMIFAALGGTGYVLTRQLVDLATKLPDYKVNIQTKLRSFKTPAGGTFTRFTDTVEELKKDLPGADETPPVVAQAQGRPDTLQPLPPGSPTPVPVQVVQSNQPLGAETPKTSPVELVQLLVAPLLGPLGTAALVLLLVIFMLFQREDLRGRIIRLIGQGRISATTRAMDDASARVSRYLLMQLIVNVTYGIPVAVGLYFIGVPNALLWGALAIVLRFIPYVGPWIAAAFPIALSLAVSPGWMVPLMTIGLFVVLELVSNNVMEPWLYGSSTGVSSIALIIAAVFWTWLWGPVGLVLATPLTVCLVVMGRYVPRLSFLSVVLSDEEALTPAEDCYHRLLTVGEQDEMELVDAYLRTHTLTELYDSVFIPVIAAAETDHRLEVLDAEQRLLVEQSMHDIIDDLGTRPAVGPKVAKDADAAEDAAPVNRGEVYCLPARASRDELAGTMLAQLLQREGFTAESASGKLTAGELLTLVEKSEAEIAVISVVPPSTVIHARYLCSKLRQRSPKLKIVVGLWALPEGAEEAARRLRDSGADEVVFNFAEAVPRIVKLAPPVLDEMIPPPVPANEAERLETLASLQLLNGEGNLRFDRITAKLARILDVPIALVTLVDRDRQVFKSQSGLPGELAEKPETPRELSVCAHVIVSEEPLVVDDLARDRRFAGNPLLKKHGLRFYAGVPLRAPNGVVIGTLCVLDTKPRQASAQEKRLLQEYADEIMAELRELSAKAAVPAA